MSENKKYYYNLVKHLNGRPSLHLENSPAPLLDKDSDYYKSVYDYPEEEKQNIEQKSSIAGITNVSTTRVIFDLDKKEDIESARKDTVNLVRKLLELGLQKPQIRTYFSGGKGFHVEFTLNRRITPQEHKNFAINVAGEFSSFDPVVYNAARFIRVENTKHQDSGLYKTPLTVYELRDLSLENILELAKSIRNDFQFEDTLPASVNVELFRSKEIKEVKPLLKVGEYLDWSKKPRWLSNCRWALQNGYFKEGMRSNGLSCLAATYKAQGFTKEHTEAFLNTVCELQASVNDCDRFDESELYNVITPVYSDNWKGGIYTCKEPGWLQNYCNNLGEHSCQKANLVEIVKTAQIATLFDTYVNDIEKNMLTTGIQTLDNKMNIMVGTSTSVVGSPGTGKTSLSLQLLKHNSDLGIHSMFFSYDMFHSALFTRQIQNSTGLQQKEIFDIFKNNRTKKQQILDKMEEEYKNVSFCFKSGQTLEDMEYSISETEDRLGQKIKLVIIDYNELLITKSSDPTQASAEIAQTVRRIANEKQVAMVLLLQPSKMYSSPSDEVKSMNSAKGSSAIAQAQTLMLGISRPGHSPLHSHDDQFFNITCLKNRNGGLFSVDLRWHGLTGKISELEYGDEEYLQTIRERRDAEKRQNEGF